MDLAPLIAALILVESGGNDSAVNPLGPCLGPLQITEVCRLDVNRISGRTYTWEDCFDRAKAVEMSIIYIGHYCTTARLGRAPTLQDAARIWNGGPAGWANSSTLPYWHKVQEILSP